jgi:hypothetical protein
MQRSRLFGLVFVAVAAVMLIALSGMASASKAPKGLVLYAGGVELAMETQLENSGSVTFGSVSCEVPAATPVPPGEAPLRVAFNGGGPESAIRGWHPTIECGNYRLIEEEPATGWDFEFGSKGKGFSFNTGLVEYIPNGCRWQQVSGKTKTTKTGTLVVSYKKKLVAEGPSCPTKNLKTEASLSFTDAGLPVEARVQAIP